MSLSHFMMGLLRDASDSGYDLNKRFDQSVGHFWRTEHSQIYRALHSMTEKGWVRVEHVEQDTVPDKKIYHLTDSGLSELRRWLAQPLDTSKIHDAWTGQIFFGDLLTNAEVMHLIEVRRARIQPVMQFLVTLHQWLKGEAAKQPYSRLRHFRMMSQEYVMQVLGAELAWLDMMQAQVLALPEDDPPGA